MTTTLYFLTLALLTTHEIDAVKRHEWRLLPGLSRLNDEDGFNWFTALHVPLFFLIFYFSDTLGFRSGLAIFALAHGVVHWLLRTHPLYEFHNWLSKSLIFGAALSGAVYLMLTVAG